MPKLLDETMQNLNTQSHYGFSATRIDALGASKYTLVEIVMDISSSVCSYAAELGVCLKEIINACKKDDNAENLMIRVTFFNHGLCEYHGFKLLNSLNPDDYLNVVQPSGSTALYDAAVESIEAASTYGKQLVASDFSANCVVFIITDGEDNMSKHDVSKIKAALATAQKAECLESINTVLVGVCPSTGGTTQYLTDLQQNAGFQQYVCIGDGSANKLAKLAQFVSKSVSSTSQALGTGGPSKSLSF